MAPLAQPGRPAGGAGAPSARRRLRQFRYGAEVIRLAIAFEPCLPAAVNKPGLGFFGEPIHHGWPSAKRTLSRCRERAWAAKERTLCPGCVGPAADIGACDASIESPRVHRAVDMPNQNGDIDALNGRNSKSSKDVRQVHPKARMRRRVGDRP